MTDKTVDLDDLDAFDKALYGTENPEELNPEGEELEEDELEDDSLATEDTDEDEPEDDDPPAKPKKNGFQERIDELTAARREAERDAAELRRRLDELEAANKPKEDKPSPAQPTQKTEGPSPDDVDENGDAKYVLGEFDPAYLRDLVRYENAKEREEFFKQQEALKAQETAARAQQALTEEWNGKLEAVQETLPDIREKGAKLVEAFADLDPGHGEYLATAIMRLPHGPEVLYYLSDNIDEAKKLASQDPLMAAIRLGEMSARYSDEVKPEKKVRVTDAPPPPQARVRGAGGKFTVPDDTDDLEAFEKKFYG